jgi:RimJ/RimL family protein N-acetyltransferase
MEPVLRLELFTAAHLPEFAVLARDPDVLRFTRFPDPPQDAFPEQWLARYEAGRRNGTKEAFAILGPKDEPELLGVALAVEIDRAARAAELGYLTGPAARGRGIATEALRQLTRWARDEQGLQELTLIIDAENAGSRKVAERAGYALVRIDRDAELKPGRRGDLVVYELGAEAASDASGAPQASTSSGGGTL